ncbi:UPF0728 protein-like [Symsagittifera roscoffensis]|uniref:UPF0728 protein-like n=1 Tax=Symsagittifera roscoffensis TaxID=84072 RepID=UPI00307C89C4
MCTIMPEKAKVHVYYGPYDCLGYVAFRESRLDGIRTLLEKNEHEVHFHRIEDRDQVRVMVNGEMVYECTIQGLDFGGDGLLDPKCQEILRAVNSTY